ncbi:claspin [Helicoverpa armigera]|uniref:claspin n=1 Tax=Helicoverpa armigera TaxID=29058 RepID=UPI003082C199
MALVEYSSNVGFQLNSSDEESAPVKKIRRRVQQFSDSDTEKENVRKDDNKVTQDDKSEGSSDSESENNVTSLKSGLIKSRIQLNGNSSDSDSPSRIETTKNEEQQMRMKNKRNKMKDKFKGLLKSRGMKSSKDESNEHSKSSSESSHSEVSDPSDNEMSSVAKIKQKIRKSMATMSNICDPDTSDEESEMNKSEMPKQKPRKQQKSTKLIEAKPVRMSAKQAMENMQLIKSESNRMLREKAVSLPYHRPKALSLKDIMSRRKPAVASDGKALPIKMNEEQLKHYALLLEQRQKEMMELCKSESDEETAETEEKKDEIPKSTEEASSNTNTELDNVPEKAETPIEGAENDSTDVNMVAANNDESYNELIQKEVDKTSSEADNINNEVVDSEKQVETNEQLEDTEKNDSNTDFKLVYNDSVEEENIPADQSENVRVENNLQNDLTENNEDELNNSELAVAVVNTEPESQLIALHFTENNTEEDPNKSDKVEEVTNEIEMDAEDKNDDFFSDDDVNMEDIDRLIENAEIMKDNDNVNSPMLIRDPLPPNAKPKLTGAPGMVIDLDGGGFMPKKSGVELLKERFTYFARLKTPEEIEREKEKKLKPGAQHLKLKQELEEKIAEQRSLEWAKRLEEEKQQHMEMDTILDDADDSFEKIEAKLDENDKEDKEESSSESGEEEPEENDIEIKDKPRKHNAMLDEEAEESDCEENEEEAELSDKGDNEELEGDEAVVEQDDDDEEESSDDESSESEVEEPTKVKKGRILKAFEDSDDEEVTTKPVETETVAKDSNETNEVDAAVVSNDVQSSSQDDVIQLAQRHQSASDDLFTSQESSAVIEKVKDGINTSDEVLGTQTFSILDSTTGCNNTDLEFKTPSEINILCMSQPYKDPSVDAIVNGSQLPITQSSQSQPIGEDILALCTGKFYDNEFVSPSEINQYVEPTSQDLATDVYFEDTQPNKPETIDDFSKVDTPLPEIPFKEVEENKEQSESSVKPNKDRNLLKSILDELDDPEFDKPKPNKFFTGGTQKKDNEPVVESTQMKKKFTIDSDDDDEPKETNLELESNKRKKKLKKKKPEKRALQISDDEEEEEEEMDQEEDDYMSDLEEETERLVEYDSEENEIEVKADKPKKKRKVTDFFEQEAELTSEDEWVGSGDEDEKGLDRMEREAGDDEVFHQGKLRRELGQIHMRDVLDQDKREVRIIQELLFEDGDLGDGHRQRKFRWRNAGDDDEVGTVPDEFADTQEEEFESEEQWRKQRHEREVFLRQMQQEEEEGSLNVTVNRTTIIKANLSSKSMSTLLQEVNQVNKEETTEAPAPVVKEKNTAKDIPSPKKAFSIFQQNYHGSLLTRGRGALARLAALATPLAADDDAPKIGTVTTHKRNFVFTALTQDDDDAPKVTLKRKADTNLGTPKLMKKMKKEEKQDKLFPYAEENVKDFLTNHWETDDVKEAVVALRKLALEDKENSVDGVVAIPGEDASKEDQIEGLVKSVKWQMSQDRKVGALKQLQGLIWKQGYDKGDIKGHVYDDVSPALDLWRSVDGQKVYIYSSGSVQAQKLLFGQSLAGDMLKLIDGHFDTAVGAKQEAASYAAIAEKIGCKPEEILFLTDIVKEAEAARASGVHSALVSREGNAPLPAEATAAYPVLYSLATLANPNKRKPDAQDDQPAKVLKTDVDADVKTASETDATSEAQAPAEANTASEAKADDKKPAETDASTKTEATPVVKESSAEKAAPEANGAEPAVTPKAADEPEKMDVEEEAAPELKPEEAKTEVVAEKVETVVEEVTDSNEIADTPVCDIEPIIEESSDKTELPETEKMETESSDVPEPKAELKNGDKDAPVPEETPPASVITEIKDITNDKDGLSEVTEMIEDLEPVVEEPPATQDMEELQNVGEVLEKECDEILSKVQDVTNLDNIPLKPLLNTIAEETMETENLDSNDIVERILDSEMEMEMKETAEKDRKAAEAAAESKAAPDGETTEKQEVANNETVTPVEKPTEVVAEVQATDVANDKIDSSSPKITDDEAKKLPADEKDKKTEADKVENKIETEISSTPETDDSKTKVAEAITEKAADKKIDAEEKKAETDKPEPEKKDTPAEQSKVESETPVESKESQKVPEEVKPDSEPKETKEAQVNGKATNGDAAIVNQNGDASKEDELSSRLSMENGKEVVNGANGDSTKTDQDKTEKSTEVDVADIKVKTVAVDEPRNDPIEQPTEA